MNNNIDNGVMEELEIAVKAMEQAQHNVQMATNRLKLRVEQALSLKNSSGDWPTEQEFAQWQMLAKLLKYREKIISDLVGEPFAQ